MKKVTIVLLVFFFSVNLTLSQNTTDTTSYQAKKEEKKEQNQSDSRKSSYSSPKIYYGAGVGLTFGSFFRLSLRPMIAYKITPKLSAGVELVYEYIVDNRFQEKYNYSNYGFSVIARYRIIPQLYLHVEPSMINYKAGYEDGEDSREWVEFIFVGAGYSQRISHNTWAFAQVKFDVLNSNDYYKRWTPFWNIGVSVNF